jgi:hypothetical protein
MISKLILCDGQGIEEFDIKELEEYVNKAKSSNIESLYFDACEIVRKYIEQGEDIITIYAADIIWSYFQDSFPTTHYINLTGDKVERALWGMYFNLQAIDL